MLWNIEMKLIQFGTKGTGIHMYPVCVSWYDIDTREGKHYIVEPVEFWDSSDDDDYPPSTVDAEEKGIHVSCLSNALNKDFGNETVYTENPIKTWDCINRIYQACGDNPTFSIENIHEVIPQVNYDLYVRICNLLCQRIDCSDSYGALFVLSGAVSVLRKPIDIN